MAAAEFDVKYVAHLARIALSPEEEQKLGAQLGNILGYIEKLKQADVSGVEPTAHAFPLVNVTRPDVIQGIHVAYRPAFYSSAACKGWDAISKTIAAAVCETIERMVEEIARLDLVISAPPLFKGGSSA